MARHRNYAATDRRTKTAVIQNAEVAELMKTIGGINAEVAKLRLELQTACQIAVVALMLAVVTFITAFVAFACA